MTTGLILLVFIAVLVGFGVARVRKRMGLGVTGALGDHRGRGGLHPAALWVTAYKH